MSVRKQNINFLTVNKYVDLDIKRDVLGFHHRGNIQINPLLHRRVNHPPLPHHVLATLEGYDLEINPFHSQDVPCNSLREVNVKRARTAQQFAPESMDFAWVQTLLNESFAADDERHRPYPAGGALYMVEVLCCLYKDKLVGSPDSGIYHYRPNLRVLQPLKTASAETLRKRLLPLEFGEQAQPNFSLIYLIHLGKATVKYRYRGYRLALMEVGSMYQQADLVAKELGMKNKVCSSFGDLEVTKFCELDYDTYLPAVMQLFGQ